MRDYSTRTLHEVEIEWDFDVSPGYPATRTDPAEPDTVENVRAMFCVGKKRIPVPDDLAAALMDEAELLSDAMGQREQAMCDAAEARREVMV